MYKDSTTFNVIFSVLVGAFCDHIDTDGATVRYESGSQPNVQDDDILQTGVAVIVDCGTKYYGDVHQITITCQDDNR